MGRAEAGTLPSWAASWTAWRMFKSVMGGRTRDGTGPRAFTTGWGGVQRAERRAGRAVGGRVKGHGPVTLRKDQLHEAAAAQNPDSLTRGPVQTRDSKVCPRVMRISRASEQRTPCVNQGKDRNSNHRASRQVVRWRRHSTHLGVRPLTPGPRPHGTPTWEVSLEYFLHRLSIPANSAWIPESV